MTLSHTHTHRKRQRWWRLRSGQMYGEYLIKRATGLTKKTLLLVREIHNLREYNLFF